MVDLLGRAKLMQEALDPNHDGASDMREYVLLHSGKLVFFPAKVTNFIVLSNIFFALHFPHFSDIISVLLTLIYN
ncbi:hypothetical protein ACJX0J_021731, partial [Zea mays]